MPRHPAAVLGSCTLALTLAAVGLPACGQILTGDLRVAAARERHDARIRQHFRDLDLPYPPAAVLLRYFKHERELELWAGVPGTPLTLVRTYTATGSSGTLGPKRREGDHQIPEGFYVIDRYNPRSRFHLSLGIDYPNVVDRARAGEDAPGGDIFIHGGEVTVGCIPMGDEAIEELYLIALDTRVANGIPIPAHFFPCRMDAEGLRLLERAAGGDGSLLAFWDQLEPVYRAFERTRRVPGILADSETGYGAADIDPGISR